jgi:hypothetical protein
MFTFSAMSAIPVSGTHAKKIMKPCKAGQTAVDGCRVTKKVKKKPVKKTSTKK